MKIAGLPFTNGARRSAVTLHVNNLTFAATYPQAYVEASATTVALTTVATGAAEAVLAIDTAATIDANGSYSVI
jgi:hypothetical protein